jgi:hypothetical protein
MSCGYKRTDPDISQNPGKAKITINSEYGQHKIPEVDYSGTVIPLPDVKYVRMGANIPTTLHFGERGLEDRQKMIATVILNVACNTLCQITHSGKNIPPLQTLDLGKHEVTSVAVQLEQVRPDGIIIGLGRVWQSDTTGNSPTLNYYEPKQRAQLSAYLKDPRSNPAVMKYNVSYGLWFTVPLTTAEAAKVGLSDGAKLELTGTNNGGVQGLKKAIQLSLER